MKKTRLVGLLVACSVASGVSAQTAAPAQPTSAQAADFVLYTQIVSSRRDPEDLGSAINDIMSNPIIGPAIVIGAAYLGLPAEAIVPLGSAAARAQQEKMQAERANPNKGHHIYTLKAPDGYSLCAARFGAISIHPRSDQRPKVTTTGSLGGVVMDIRHRTQAFGKGRSTVKVRVDLLAVKTDQLGKYTAQCRLTKSAQTLIPLCRGSDCDAPMNGSVWRGGDY